MNKKIITAIIAFVVAFGFSTAVTRVFFAPFGNFYSFGNKDYAQNRQKIHAFLQQDVRNAQKRNAKLEDEGIYTSPFSIETVITEADSIAEYTDLTENLDDSNLPREFQAAWRDHVKAWREYADFSNSVTYSCHRSKFTDDEIAETSKQRNRQISDTWYKVLRVANRYDAIPAGAL